MKHQVENFSVEGLQCVLNVQLNLVWWEYSFKYLKLTKLRNFVEAL
jgi:hypothetical protein